MRKILSLLVLVLSAMMGVTPAVAAKAAGTYGVVTDPSGHPIGGAQVEVYRLGTGLVALLDTDGHGGFRQESPVDSASLWQIRVWAAGYRTLETGWMDLAAHRRQAFKLEPMTGALHLSVRSADGDPVDGTVLLVSAGGELVRQITVTGGLAVEKGLPPGSYRAIVTARGYLPAAAAVSITAGDDGSAVFVLEQGGVLFAGEVRDATSGKPISGGAVEVLGDTGSAAVVLAAVATDESAAFQIALPQGAAGAYRLRVAAAGYQPLTTQSVTVASGQRHEWRGGEAIPLQPSVGHLVGLLTDVFGQPLSQSKLVLQLKGYGEVAEGKTDTDGSFRFDGITVGAGNLYQVSFHDTGVRADSGWVELKPGRNDLAVQVQREYTWSFASGSVSGVVRSSVNAPVEGAKVELLRTDTIAKSAVTATDGSFLLTDVPANKSPFMAGTPYTVRISKEGYTTTREFTVGGQPTMDLVVQNQGRSVIQAVLIPAAIDLRGRVTDAQGHRVADASVQLRVDGSPDAWVAHSDAQGWYSLKGVPVRPAGRYSLRVQAAGYLPQTGLDATAAVTGSGRISSIIMTARATTFVGQVFGSDGSPLDDVFIELRGPEGGILSQVRTNAAGIYVMSAEVPRSGDLVLTAIQPGWTEAVVEIATPPAAGTTVNHDLTIRRMATRLEGAVLDQEGLAVPDATVELLREGRGVVATVTTGGDGRYAFADIKLGAPGWFWLRVTSRDAGFAGSLTHQTDLVPLLWIMPGESVETDLLIRRAVPVTP